VNKSSPIRPVHRPARPVGHPPRPPGGPFLGRPGALAAHPDRQLFEKARAGPSWGRPGRDGDDEVPRSFCPARPSRPSPGRGRRRPSPVPRREWDSCPTPVGPATGFLCSPLIQKNARWGDEFGLQHFLTKSKAIWARRVCKKGPLKGGRSLRVGVVMVLVDLPPPPGAGRSRTLLTRPTGQTFLGRSATTPGGLSVASRGAPWSVAAAPPVEPPWAVDRWADGVGTNGDLSCAPLCWVKYLAGVQGRRPRRCPPRPPCWPPAFVQWVLWVPPPLVAVPSGGRPGVGMRRWPRASLPSSWPFH